MQAKYVVLQCQTSHTLYNPIKQNIERISKQAINVLHKSPKEFKSKQAESSQQISRFQ